MFRSLRCAVCINKNGVKTIGNGGNLSFGSTMPILTDKQYTRVADYYAGKSVFITGASGFLGKVFVERLLYNCKDIETIYVLIRPKEGQNASQRLTNMFEVPLFQKLKEARPNDLKKVIAIEGDITAPKLGIKAADEQKLIDRVSVVFHSAANVRFADHFNNLVTVNVEGTKNVMDLTKNMKKVDTFIHISTAFSNGIKRIMDEKLYPPTRDLEEIRRFVKEHGNNDKKFEKFQDSVHSNTYALSKGLGEDLVNKYRENIPTVIIRPSVVSPLLAKPLNGWTDTWLVSTAFFSNAARGLISVQYGNEDTVCPLIPVDYVTNFSIVAGARGNKSGDVLVYNICTSSQNPITWQHAYDLFLEESRKVGLCKRKTYNVSFTTSPFIATTVTFFKNMIPSIFADIGLVVRGQKPRHLRELSRAVWFRSLMRPFSRTSWLIKCNRTLALIASLDEHDRKTFPCDPNTINWKEYMPIYYRGVKKYLLKRK